MTAKPVVHLHVGIHKTGSTFLQRVFLQSLSGAHPVGVTYIPFPDVRSRITPAVLRAAKGIGGLGGVGLRDCRDFLAASMARTGSIFLSDENLLGSLYRFSRAKGVYPDAQQNLKAIASLLKRDADIVIYLSIRNYAGWLESVYLQFLKKRKKLISFEEFLDLACVESISWYSLVYRLTEAIPSARIVLWRYEDFVDNNQKILDGIASVLGDDVKLGVVDFEGNPSLSVVAYDALMAARAAGIRKEDARKLVKFVRTHLAVNSGYPRPRLFGKGDVGLLAKQYENDLALLRELTNVCFLG
jgi:hypothetical protein